MRRAGVGLWFGLGLLVGLSSCGDGDEGAPSTACQPGDVLSCACGGASTGTVTCEDFLAHTGICNCPQAQTGGTGGVPAGGMGGSSGASGMGGMGGMGGGSSGAGGTMGGTGGVSGMSGGIGGASGMTGGASGMTGGMSGMGGMGGGGAGGDPGEGETGVLVGFTAAHNEKRAMVDVTPPMAPLTWDDDAAAFAQSWADTLAASCEQAIEHSPPPRAYGENIAAFFGFGGGSGPIGSPEQVVENWHAEVACWDYGTINGTEDCDMACVSAMFSNGCGHYTQVVWADTQRVGCGYASCDAGGEAREYWVCSYDPPGNYENQTPY